VWCGVVWCKSEKGEKGWCCVVWGGVVWCGVSGREGRECGVEWCGLVLEEKGVESVVRCMREGE
jgi:hypothetical protein